MACGLCKFEGGLLHKMLHSSEVEHYRENKTGYIVNCKSYELLIIIRILCLLLKLF